MLTNYTDYRKLIAAIVGLTVLFLYRQYDIDIRGTESLWIDFVLISGELFFSAVTAAAVWWYPNTKNGECQNDLDVSN